MLIFLDSVCSIYYDRDLYVVSIQGMQCSFSLTAFAVLIILTETCMLVYREFNVAFP
jgi:hypothetical protein